MTQKVLVVDDARVVRISLGRILKKLGFEIIEAENGKEAYEAMNAHPDIALVMLDWNMPVMNGYDLCEKLKIDPSTKHIPIIMLTAKDMGDDIDKALEKKADWYIVKPPDGKYLVRKIESLLKREQL